MPFRHSNKLFDSTELKNKLLMVSDGTGGDKTCAADDLF